jgi:hypothetical protein
MNSTKVVHRPFAPPVRQGMFSPMIFNFYTEDESLQDESLQDRDVYSFGINKSIISNSAVSVIVSNITLVILLFIFMNKE